MISLPFRRICPSVGRSKPAIIRRVVVFPQPEGPRKVTNSPFLTSRLKSETARKPSSNFLVRCFNSMMFSFVVISVTSRPDPEDPSTGHRHGYCGRRVNGDVLLYRLAAGP